MKIMITKLPSNTMALGGVLQTHGADWGDGLMTIGAGGTHEENKYDGVQLGRDENLVPNLVEEGEAIFNDYVFSNRIPIDNQTKQRFHIGKKREMTYADLAKKLEKEIAERTNDPISRAGFKAQMQQLQDEQERQKQEMEAERAREAFEALSDEEKVALMQQAQQEQMAQNNMQEQAVAQQQMMDGANIGAKISPEEAMMQGQEGVPAAETMGAIPVPQMAYGGKVNKFDLGGEVMKTLGMHTWSDFVKWAKKNKVYYDDSSLWDKLNSPDDLNWESLLTDDNFKKAISESNPALADALEKGYDFGQYKVSSPKYDLETFRKVLSEYTKSKKQGNTQGMYAIDNDFGLGEYKTIKELEESPEYKAYTQYLTDMLNRAKGIQWRRKDKSKTGVYDNVEFKDGKTLSKEDYDTLFTLAKTAEGTSTKDKGDFVPIFDYDVDGDGWYGLRDDALQTVLRLRGDQKGGIFHLNPSTIKRSTQTNNYVINEDGTVEPIVGDVPTDWTPAGNYSWATPENDLAYNYYKRPAVATPEEQKAVEEDEEDSEEKTLVPRHRAEWPRYAGLFGPAVGLGMQLAGVGKPDYSGLNGVLDAYNRRGAALADYKPIGDYLRYEPMDIWYEQNRLNGNARATDRAIQNNAGPLGTQIAGLVANEYNNQIASGNLYRQALEYNNNLRERTATFNRGTNQFNAEAYNRAALQNAQIKNHDRSLAAQLGMQAAQTKLGMDADWYNSLYGNVGGLFKGLGDLGRENALWNMVSKTAADTTNLGDSNTADIYLKTGKKKSKGGKIKRKKGLTF